MNQENQKQQEAILKKLHYILGSKNNSLRERFPDTAFGFEADRFPLNIRIDNPGFQDYILELGSGWGEFALEYAAKNPHSFYLATDKKRYRILKSLKLHSAENKYGRPVRNLKWLVSNFDWAFGSIFQTGSFDKIIINFPDPWPKKRHAKHRFIKFEFIRDLHGVLAPGGQIDFATDSWNYMESALSDFNRSGLFENINGKNVILETLKDRPQSFFEKLKREEKENIYFIQLRKFS